MLARARCHPWSGPIFWIMGNLSACCVLAEPDFDAALAEVQESQRENSPNINSDRVNGSVYTHRALRLRPLLVGKSKRGPEKLISIFRFPRPLGITLQSLCIGAV